MQTTANTIKPMQPALMAAVVLGILSVLGVFAARVAGASWRRAAEGAPTTPAEVVSGLAAAVAVGLMTWLAVGVVLALAAGLPGRVGRRARAMGDALTPALVRRAVGCTLGVTVAAGVAPGASVAAPAPTSAIVTLDRPDPAFTALPDPGWSPPTSLTAPGRPSPPTDAEDDGRSRTAGPGTGSAVGGGADDILPPDPGWVPEPPLVRPLPDLAVLAPTRPPTPGPLATEVVVHRGDTLWSIAARSLGDDASDAEVAAVWPAWFEANRDVVGDDPDLLLPGQVLRAPEAVAR